MSAARSKDNHRRSEESACGHANIVLTLDVYSHVQPDMQEAAAEKLEALIFRKAVMQ